MAQSLVSPDDFLEEAEVLRRWPMLTARELKRARKANPPLIGFYNFTKARGGPRYTPEQVQRYLDQTYLQRGPANVRRDQSADSKCSGGLVEPSEDIARGYIDSAAQTLAAGFKSKRRRHLSRSK